MRRAVALGAALACTLSCAGPEPNGDAGFADAGFVDAGFPDPDAGFADAGSILDCAVDDAGVSPACVDENVSCAALIDEFGALYTDAFIGLDEGCTRDEDCIATGKNFQCGAGQFFHSGCELIVTAAHVCDVAAALNDLSAAFCGQCMPSTCAALGVCGPQELRCIDGRCAGFP